jgi:oxepin-CoA hydrolase/3-oxo-5,6-dehydrosuberyl-CoA semialdehyde dehydrogenase
MTLESYAVGKWFAGAGGDTISNAVSGEPVCLVSSKGLDFKAMLDHARKTGGPALRTLTFHERALRLKALAQYLLERKEKYYALSHATGATRNDSWIDIEGGIMTLFAYSSKGRKELPNQTFLVDGTTEALSKNGTFVGLHICTPLQGCAVHINAYNFPCWGMLEKISVNLLAGMPAIVKPASQTAFLTEAMFRDIIASGIFPEGALQLICGSTGDLLSHLESQDAVTFTGSASTGRELRQMPAIQQNSVRFTMEADSLNFSLLAPDATTDQPEFDLFVKEVVREMTTKAGQKCTAIRRAFAPRDLIEPLIAAIGKRLSKVVLGDPLAEGVTMGALASLGQRDEVRERVQELRDGGAELVFGDPTNFDVKGADIVAGAFLGPMLLHSPQPKLHTAAHSIEAFGPVATLMPYDSLEDAVELVKMGEGSLVGSIFTYDNKFARDLVMGTAAFHGRMLIINRDCAKESTGHGSPLPGLVHGGPGRAGGGEEMGGIRGVMHYLQRTALQGSPETLTQIGQRWLTGSERHEGMHPFRKYIEELELGDCVVSTPKLVTLKDIEHFAEFTGDKFYAHMDEAAAKANPFFGGRVAHGYYIVSLAAGLFVDPDPGPVLANTGVDNLRFITPVFPGDSLKVILTCKAKNPRETENYGEVRWDAVITNQDDKLVAQYDVLTMVEKKPLESTTAQAAEERSREDAAVPA